MSKHKLKIFGQEHHAMLKKAQRQLHDLLPVLDDAEACGADCEAFRAIVKENVDQLNELEARFMSPIPK